MGLAGLIPFVIMFILIFRESYFLYRHSAGEGFYGRELVLAFWQMSIAFLVCINFVDPSMDEFLPGYFLAVAGVIVRRAELARNPAAAQAAGVTFGRPA